MYEINAGDRAQLQKTEEEGNKGREKKETEETLSLEVLRRVIFGKALVCIHGLQHLTMRIAPLESDT